MAGWFLGVLAVTWSFWGASALLAADGAGGSAALSRMAFYAGGVTPLLMALLALQRESRLERNDFWRRLLDLRRMRAADWARALLPAPLVLGAAVLIAGLVDDEVTASVVTPASWLLTPAFLLLFGPLPEEIAWRGWALDRLQKTESALLVSLLLAAVWALWHLPLFFIDGTYQQQLGVGTAAFWLFMLALLPQSIVLTWVFNSCRRTIAAPIVLHWMINLTGELVATPLATEVLLLMVWGLFAAALVARHGPQRLSTDPAAAERYNRRMRQIH